MTRRRAVLGLVGLLGVLALGVALAAWRDLTAARAQLLAARRALDETLSDAAPLRDAEGRAATGRSLQVALQRLGRADRQLRRSRPLTALRLVPGLAAQRAGALSLVADATTAARMAETLVDGLDALDGRVRLQAGTLPLGALAHMEEASRAAGTRLKGLRRPAGGLWGPLADGRRSFNRDAARAGSRLTDGADALGAARSFLGAGGPRRYLLALQNNSEMRDQGMVLSYAVARLEQGNLTVDRAGSITELALTQPISLPMAPGTQAVFGGLEPTRLWQSVNATADFAWSGRVMAEMYARATGTPVDGVVALDVPGLAAILRVVGPVTVPGIHEAVGSDNAARVLLKDLYDRAPLHDQAGRRERLALVVTSVVSRLTTGSHDAVALGQELGQAAAGGHLRLWSRTPAEEKVFERTGLGGGPATHRPDRTFHLSVQAATATKLDYYVRPHLRMQVFVTEQGTAVVRSLVTVDNQAPEDAGPSYQLGPDGYGTQDRPGQYVTRVYLWSPSGARQDASFEESGLVLTQAPLEVDPGRQGEVRFETVIPRAVRDGRLHLRVVPQPRLSPVPVEVNLVEAPGWTVEGSPTVRGNGDKTLNVAWELQR